MTDLNNLSAKRRVLNQIWNCAEKYDFEPIFTANDTKSKSDLYMNCIIGLAYKYYGEKAISDIFEKWGDDPKHGLYDNVAWICIENAVFDKELSERPVLHELRMEHSIDFLDQENTLAGNERKIADRDIYDLQLVHWKNISGNKKQISSRSMEIENAMSTSVTLSGKELESKIIDILCKYFSYDPNNSKKDNKKNTEKSKVFYHWMKFLRPKGSNSDSFSFIRDSEKNGTTASKGIIEKARSFFYRKNYETDLLFIESYFGRSIYSLDKLKKIEDKVCINKHYGCHLWITDGTSDKNKKIDISAKDALIISKKEKIFKNNLEHYNKNKYLYDRAISILSEHISNSLSVFSERENYIDRAGILSGELVWKEKILNNNKVFIRKEDKENIGFTVDLMLDGSASRRNDQEIIAAQGYILAESIKKCNIPVRVTSYSTIKGHTVINILKDANSQDTSKIFNYSALGWNRDGLAIRAMKEMPFGTNDERRILIVLTDGAPNDGTKIYSKTGAFSRDYSGKYAIEDTSEEVYKLRYDKIFVGGIFTGGNEDVEGATKIFDKDYVRIKDMKGLASATGKLITKAIEKVCI